MAQVPTPASVKPTPEVHSVLVPASAVVPASTVVHASAGSSAGASPPPQFLPSYQRFLFIAQQRSWRMLNLVGFAANIGARMLQTPAWLIWASVLVLHFWILRIINTYTGVNNEITARDSLSYATPVGGVWLITLYAG